MDQIKSAKSQGYNAIVCRLVNGETASQIEKVSQGIPIVYLNSEPNAKYLEPDKYIYVGSEEYMAGTFQAEYALSKLVSNNEINVAIFQGEKGNSATKGRTESIEDVLAKSNKNINYVFNDSGNWDETTANHYFKLLAKTNPTIDVVFCNNDSMAIGVAKAIKELHMENQGILVLGVDATSDACKLIKNGDMTFTACQNASAQANAAVDVIELISRGKSISDYEHTSDNGYEVWVDFEKVDSSNVDKYM